MVGILYFSSTGNSLFAGNPFAVYGEQFSREI